MQKDKPKFIRKNGRIIPVGVDKKGKDKKPSNKKSKPKGDSYNAQKSSYYGGKMMASANQANKHGKREGEIGRMFTLGGAASGALIGKKGKRGKAAALGALAGLVGGYFGSRGAAEKKNKYKNKAIKNRDKSKSYYDKLKNKVKWSYYMTVY